MARANLTAFTGWLAAERGLRFGGYGGAVALVLTDLDGFWQAVWDYFGDRGVGAARPRCWAGAPCRAPNGSRAPDQLRRHMLRHERPDANAVLHLNESTALAGCHGKSWPARCASSPPSCASWA